MSGRRVYKGSVTTTQATASAVHNIQQMSQVKFNAVRLEALSMVNNAGVINTRGPFFVYVDSLKPVCFDLINGNLVSIIGGAQVSITDGSFVCDHLAPIKRTSGRMDVMRTPITVTILGPDGAIITGLGVNPTISVTFSLWEVDELYSSAF